jgi:hypothetical protein
MARYSFKIRFVGIDDYLLFSEKTEVSADTADAAADKVYTYAETVAEESSDIADYEVILLGV